MCRACRIKKCHKVGMNPAGESTCYFYSTYLEVQATQIPAYGKSKKQQKTASKSPEELPNLISASSSTSFQAQDFESTSTIQNQNWLDTMNSSQNAALMIASNSFSPFLRSKLHEVIERNAVSLKKKNKGRNILGGVHL